MSYSWTNDQFPDSLVFSKHWLLVQMRLCNSYSRTLLSCAGLPRSKAFGGYAGQGSWSEATRLQEKLDFLKRNHLNLYHSVFHLT
jgi:hypothetical protein